MKDAGAIPTQKKNILQYNNNQIKINGPYYIYAMSFIT